MPWRVYVTASLLAYSTILQSKRVYVTISVIYNTILQPWRVYVIVNLADNTRLQPWREYVTVCLTYNTILDTLNVCSNARNTTQNVEI